MIDWHCNVSSGILCPYCTMEYKHVSDTHSFTWEITVLIKWVAPFQVKRFPYSNGTCGGTIYACLHLGPPCYPSKWKALWPVKTVQEALSVLHVVRCLNDIPIYKMMSYSKGRHHGRSKPHTRNNPRVTILLSVCSRWDTNDSEFLKAP